MHRPPYRWVSHGYLTGPMLPLRKHFPTSSRCFKNTRWDWDGAMILQLLLLIVLDYLWHNYDALSDARFPLWHIHSPLVDLRFYLHSVLPDCPSFKITHKSGANYDITNLKKSENAKGIHYSVCKNDIWREILPLCKWSAFHIGGPTAITSHSQLEIVKLQTTFGLYELL